MGNGPLLIRFLVPGRSVGWLVGCWVDRLVAELVVCAVTWLFC